jgi:Zn ribbon nucleic-acid-binding protein
MFSLWRDGHVECVRCGLVSNEATARFDEVAR